MKLPSSSLDISYFFSSSKKEIQQKQLQQKHLNFREHAISGHNQLTDLAYRS
jgi:hypothetical protein